MEPKISLPIAFLLVCYIALTDIIGIIIVFFGLDDFWIIDILTFPVTQLYFRMKGIGREYDLSMNLLQLIPYVGALPLRTVGVCMVIWADRHPESKAAQKIQAITQKLNIKRPVSATKGIAGAAVAAKGAVPGRIIQGKFGGQTGPGSIKKAA